MQSFSRSGRLIARRTLSSLGGVAGTGSARSGANVPLAARQSRALSNYSVIYNEYGDLAKVLHGEAVEMNATLEPNEILVRVLASPVNPSDYNQIQGIYPMKPKSFPAVGGMEGVAVVEQVGAWVSNVQIGDWVLPARGPLGMWRQFLVGDASADFIKVDNKMPVEAAATVAINPLTAWCLLKEMVELKPGDIVAQNAANSFVGQAVIQLAREMGIKTLNVIRSARDDYDELRNYLIGLGADYVISDKQLSDPKTAENELRDVPKAKFGVNLVGGRAAAEMCRYLAEGSHYVTIGGMSKQPIFATAASLVFLDVTYRGFWLTHWQKRQTREKFQQALNELSELIVSGKLLTPKLKPYHYTDWKQAVVDAQAPKLTRKPLLVLDERVYADLKSKFDAETGSDDK